MENTSAPPVLSTPDDHLLQEINPIKVPTNDQRLTEEELYIQYEIPRTIREIRDGRWKKIALQFPDDMLPDAPRVYERLRDGLRQSRRQQQHPVGNDQEVTDINNSIHALRLEQSSPEQSPVEAEGRLCILADTSYGACCVDEVAAEHIDAEVVVHYGRTCLSPTARLPVIYVFTSSPLDLDAVVSGFHSTYADRNEKVCLMADIPYHHHISALYNQLCQDGYTNLFAPTILHDPSSLLPNRTIPPEARENAGALKDYAIFHISTPPTSLILTLSSRVRSLQIFSTSQNPSTYQPTTPALLRRRYALLTRITTAPIIGLLINTLSVSNYMSALEHCQSLISAAGKKSYTFVVGKVNVAKLANFSEVDAWVVISCWESSLLEGPERDFLAPVVTPFELELALKGESGRLYGGEWNGDFSALLQSKAQGVENSTVQGEEHASTARDEVNGGGNWDDEQSDQEEPDFDLRTGRYASRARPMGRSTLNSNASNNNSSHPGAAGAPPAPPSSALVQRAKGDVAAINGTHSPAADFLRSKRTWQGLGSDYEIAYERDADGRIQGAAVEEGRSGVAKGYSVGEEEARS